MREPIACLYIVTFHEDLFLIYLQLPCADPGIFFRGGGGGPGPTVRKHSEQCFFFSFFF